MIKRLSRKKYSVGLFGFGKAGQAVARVLLQSPEIELKWICRAKNSPIGGPGADMAMFGIEDVEKRMYWLNRERTDYVIDFSSPAAIAVYGQRAAEQGIGIISANSAHSPEQLAFAETLGTRTRIMCAPNITRGVNFLLLAASAVRRMAPDADIAIIEEHFRTKREVSGTARKIASALSVSEDAIRSLRIGGIVGSHQVVFGFPYQTLRLSHDSISHEAFGTGALYALSLLAEQAPGFYSYEKLLLGMLIEELQRMQTESGDISASAIAVTETETVVPSALDALGGMVTHTEANYGASLGSKRIPRL